MRSEANPLKNKLSWLMLVSLVSVGVLLGFASTNTIQAKNKATIHFVAIGDSLTEGVGDTTKQQGYTKRTAHKIATRYDVTVKTANYGKAGDRSDQILARIKKQPQAVQDIKQADVIALTVGGNDLQQTLFKAIFAKSPQKVTNQVAKSMPDYTENLMKLVSFIEKHNRQAPIFLFGNYNPLYVYLANRPDLNADVRIYNGINANLAAADDQLYYVSTFRTLTYGQYTTKSAREKLEQQADEANRGSLHNKVVQKALSKSADTELNDYLTTLDHYHPNDTGYDKMSQLLMKRLVQKKSTWLEK